MLQLVHGLMLQLSVRSNICMLGVFIVRLVRCPQAFNCETMVSLKLHMVALANAEFVSLPCLKTMLLDSNEYSNEATFEKLVSSCPVLEELVVIVRRVGSCAKFFRVHSLSLKSLTISKCMSWDYVPGSAIVIDTPRLCFLSIKDELSESFKIAEMDSSVKLDLRIDFCLAFLYEAGFSSKNIFCSILAVISEVRDMTISTSTFQCICRYMKSEPLPQFVNMSRLHVDLSVSDLKLFPTFLESFPNLKSLIVIVCSDDYRKPTEISFSSVPVCMLSSLEFVDFKGLF